MLLRPIKTLFLPKEVIWSLTYAAKHTITNVFVQGFFQKIRIIFINKPLAKKRTHLAFATKSPRTFAKAYSRQSVVRVNTLSFCDCAHNVLQGNVEISHHHKQKLKPHKTKLRKLTDRKVALKTKQRIIQKGGFLPILLSALASVISGVLGSLIKQES